LVLVLGFGFFFEGSFSIKACCGFGEAGFYLSRPKPAGEPLAGGRK